MKKKNDFRILRTLLTLCMSVFLFLGLISCVRDPDLEEEKPSEDMPNLPSDEYPQTLFSTAYPTSSKVGQSMEYLGTVKRKIPEVSDGGLERYPVYGQVLSGAGEEEKQAILKEDATLRASDTTYDSMDAEGNLYLNGNPTGGRLYKHTASIGMYYGNPSDEEPALKKRITIQSRASGNHITGLYAPAGEVITVEMSEEDFQKTGGLTVYIGQVLSNGQPNNIWLARDFNRMPVIVNTMKTKSKTAYVGSYLGGPIYIAPVKAGTSFSVTISGGLSYSHFILGYTTPEEFSMNQDSTVPYFDLEVWDTGVRHSGPKSYASKFDYEDLYKAAVLWDKISRVSTQVPSGSKTTIGIDFLYDPFVAAGAAVAFVGRNTVNCPPSWLTGSLDYDSFVTSGAWGNIHEYNHHFQRYGFAPGDEVTNNAVSLVSYSLFTNISAGRTVSGGLSGWNRYTEASFCLSQTLAAKASGTANSNLDTYANLLHSFGQDIFIKACQNGRGAGGVDTWFKAVCEATKYDMTYYFTDVLHQSVSESVLAEIKEKGYPMYVPVATVFQTGRSYLDSGKVKYSETVRPFEIDAGKDFEFNLEQSIVLPEEFAYRIVSVSNPENGKLTKKGEDMYCYSPNKNRTKSGKIYVELEITKKDTAFAVENVELVLEFKQKQEKANILERTTYYYTKDTMYKSVAEAVEKQYVGYEDIQTGDNINRVQNGNAEVWEPTQYSIVEVKGKIYIPSTGKYRIALRGRTYAALYVSLDGQTYSLAANMENTTGSPNFNMEDENTYTDYELVKGQYVYFKAVLLATHTNSFIGVGLGKFDGDTVSVDYLTNAYRSTAYKEGFSTSYFYTRNYTVNYSKTEKTTPSLIEAQYTPWDERYPIDLLFDEDESNYIHSKAGISEDNPFVMTVDLGKEIKANRFTLYACRVNGRVYVPTSFTLYGGTSLSDMRPIAQCTSATVQNDTVFIDFDMQLLRYYRLVATDSSAPSKYAAFRKAEFSVTLTGGNQLSPDDSRFIYKGGWETQSTQSTFGHIYIGKNATMEFEFIGTQFAIFSKFSSDFGNLEIEIDGKLFKNIDLSSGNGEIGLAFLSDKLKNGKHTVLIRSKAWFNLDSIVLWEP